VLVLRYGPNIQSRRKPVLVIDAVKRAYLTAFILLLTAGAAGAQTSTPNAADRESHLNWRPWSDAVFAEAKRDHRFVLLDLEAVWCHWCHVMHANTCSDPQVIKLLQAHYITVRHRRYYVAL
jgi:thiol:disulfide interchange protein